MRSAACRRLGRAALVALAALSTLTAFGADPAPATEAPVLSLSGFGTVGVVEINDDDLWFYRPGVNRPHAADPDFGSDSLLALQSSLRLAEHTDATLQLMVREDPTGSHSPQLTWAFLRHTLAPGLVVRGGRLRTPFLMLSDSLYVNYANPWIRPPVEVYGLNPFSDLNGADLLYRLPVAGFDLEIRPYYGSGRIRFPGGHARLRDARGINLALTGESLSLHLGHGEGRLGMQRGDAAYRGMVAALAGAGLAAMAAELSGNNGHARFESAGFQWDDGTWLLVAEYARRHASRYVTSAHAWYVTAGRRFGAVTPFVTFAHQRLDRAATRARVPDAPPLARLAAAFDAFVASRNTAQRSATLGVRWDFVRNAALKAEASRVLIAPDSWGSYFPSDPATSPRLGRRELSMFGLSMDFAF